MKKSKAEKMVEKYLSNAKFKVGDLVKWNDGKYHNNDKRIDRIDAVKIACFGGIQYETTETNNPKGTEPKRGLAYEEYLVLA